jgi:periplasmic divalent cation tolerance protein
MSTGFVSGFITTDTPESARQISKLLLEKKLIACATILPGGESHYWWQGEIESSREVVVHIKTSHKLTETIETEVTKIHPYDCPCIVFLPLVHMNPAYAEWLTLVLKTNGHASETP